MQWGENAPEDHVRYARNDLMGMVREDLAYDGSSRRLCCPYVRRVGITAYEKQIDWTLSKRSKMANHDKL
jgi:hypothetical protein